MGQKMAQPAANKPNILFFHVDNISVGDFGCYGGAYPLGAKTPNVDRFAAESLLLTNYNVEAQCTPSRAALMTGRHPIRTGCITALPGAGFGRMGGHHRRQAKGARLQQCHMWEV